VLVPELLAVRSPGAGDRGAAGVSAPSVGAVERLLALGWSYTRIADSFGTTKGVIAGVVWRAGLTPEGPNAALRLARLEAARGRRRDRYRVPELA
jgi:hypothetical protein